MSSEKSFEENLDIYLRARFTLIVVWSHPRKSELPCKPIKAACEQPQRACLAWDLADGFPALTAWSGALPNARVTR